MMVFKDTLEEYQNGKKKIKTTNHPSQIHLNKTGQILPLLRG